MNVLNVKVEPHLAIFDGTDLGITDGDIEFSPGEQSVDITAHQKGSTIQDAIRTGNKPELALTLKETSFAQLKAALTRGGATDITAVAQVFTVTCAADVSGSKNNKYFTFKNPAGDKFHVWLNVNSAGTDPAPAGSTGFAVAVATNASAPTIAAAIAAAVDPNSNFVATALSNVVTITCSAAGDCDNPVDVNSGFALDTTIEGADGALVGFGSGQMGTPVSTEAGHLILRPVKNVVSVTKTEDINFWKAYAMVDSISMSGEKERMVKVKFKILPDTNRDPSIDLWAVGDGS